MSWFKRILLGLIILAGLIGTLKDYKYFGLFGALGLFIIFLLSTTFLWQWASGNGWIGPYISIHFLSLNPLLVRRRRYSRGERYPSALCGCHSL